MQISFHIKHICCFAAQHLFSVLKTALWLFVWEIILPFDLVREFVQTLSQLKGMKLKLGQADFLPGNLNFEQTQCKKTEQDWDLLIYTNSWDLGETHIGSHYLLNYPWFPSDLKHSLQIFELSTTFPINPSLINLAFISLRCLGERNNVWQC